MINLTCIKQQFIEAQFTRKLSNTVADLKKKNVAYKKSVNFFSDKAEAATGVAL